MYIFYTMRDVCLNMYIAICKVKMIAFNAQMLQLTVNKVKKKKKKLCFYNAKPCLELIWHLNNKPVVTPAGKQCFLLLLTDFSGKGIRE